MRQARGKSEPQLPVRTAILMVLMVGCAGCQTFSLSEEDFQKQQQGKCADPETGALVGAAGTVGSLGALIGAGVTDALRK